MKKFIIVFLFLLGTTALLPSCGGSGEDKLGDEYSWLEGTWKTQDEENFGVVVIEKNRYKYVSWSWNDSPSDIKSAEWIPIDIKSRDIALLEDTFLTLSEDLSIVVDDNKKNIKIITGEYSSDVLFKEGGLSSKKEVAKDKKENKSSKATNKAIKSSSSNKAWKHAFDYGKCALFNTGFVDNKNQYHNEPSPFFIALFPFVYSEDGLEGKMYVFNLYDYGIENNDRLACSSEGNYEVHGDYIKFFNVRSKYNINRQIKNKIYKIVDDSGICLEVPLPNNSSVLMRLSSDNDIIRWAERVFQDSQYNDFDLAVDLPI